MERLIRDLGKILGLADQLDSQRDWLLYYEREGKKAEAENYANGIRETITHIKQAITVFEANNNAEN